MTLALAALCVAAAPATAESTAEAFNPTINPSVETPTPATPAVEFERDPVDLQTGPLEERVERALAAMTLQEKIGQLCQLSVYGDEIPETTTADLRAGRIGSLFYTGSAAQTREAKRIAREESRLGLPLLTPRDVIHGFRTVMPIPLGQAASWNPELVEEAARLAAEEARAEGVNWTFAPMLDISRDARWGRIAESIGEDPVLGAALARAMVRGFQQAGVAACAKHYVAYGLSEGGRDYNRTQVAVSELYNVFLKPFQAAIDAGCATVMTGFNSVNGVPASGNPWLVREVLKRDWGFDGLVVSDWASVLEMVEHGYARDRRDAARLAIAAGVDMEMATDTYRENVEELLASERITQGMIDDAVRRILRVKIEYALDDEPEVELAPAAERDRVARRLARQSMVLLKNSDHTLPLDKSALKRVAVIGPLADAARDQLGCWMLDGRAEEAVTPLAGLRAALGDSAEVVHVSGVGSATDPLTNGITAAVAAAESADVAIVCVGEGWMLSGEARSRATLNLPGAQPELVAALTATDTPVVLVVLAGRPLAIGEELASADAVLYAWHPGSQGGPALADLVLGDACPSGKLPVTFAKTVGQEPLYYNHPRTGRPALDGTQPMIGSGLPDFPEEQKYRSHYIDSDPFPLLPFGHGLSYTRFEYGEPELSRSVVEPGQILAVRVPLTNTGDRAATEVAQLYVRDVTASLVRPVRELKAFRRVRLEPGETRVLEFALSTDDLAYYDNEARRVLEPGEFKLGVGGDSTAPLSASFTLHDGAIAQDGQATRVAR